MAAIDYYNTHPPTSHGAAPAPTPAPAVPQYLAPPPPRPQRASSSPGNVYPPYQQPTSNPQTPPQFAPPPYQTPPYQQPLAMAKPSPPFAQHQPQRNSFSHQQRPDPRDWNQSYPLQRPPNGNLHPQYNQQQLAGPPQHHRPSYARPYLHPNQSSASFATDYSSDPEARRRKHSHHHKKSSSQQTSRSTATDSFLGAAGGGLIGDLIFPGLGTVGGALAGYLGGKGYGTHRKRRESNREIEQREWEQKWDPDGRRSGSSDRARRRSHDSRA